MFFFFFGDPPQCTYITASEATAAPPSPSPPPSPATVAPADTRCFLSVSPLPIGSLKLLHIIFYQHKYTWDFSGVVLPFSLLSFCVHAETCLCTHTPVPVSVAVCVWCNAHNISCSSCTMSGMEKALSVCMSLLSARCKSRKSCIVIKRNSRKIKTKYMQIVSKFQRI